jgi:hypothetical protein
MAFCAMQGHKVLTTSVLVLFIGLSCLPSTSNAQLSNLPLITDLTGSGWTIQNGNGSISVDASVPVYALEALQDAKMVPNPLDRYCSFCLFSILGFGSGQKLTSAPSSRIS